MFLDYTHDSFTEVAHVIPYKEGEMVSFELLVVVQVFRVQPIVFEFTVVFGGGQGVMTTNKERDGHF